jgi:hypothetical protein
MRSQRTLTLILAAAMGAMLAGPVAAQSLTSIQGLGYPVLATDARTEALGGLGLGLQGLSAPMTNPAAAAGLLRRGAIVSVSAVEQTATLTDESGSFGATRFPLIQVIYPIRGVVVTAGYGGYLDQSWGVERSGTQDAGGTTVSYRDFVRSVGGIGQFQLGAAVPLGSRLAIGAAVGGHTGEQRLQFQRLFDTTSLGQLETFVETRGVQYSAPMAQLGVRWDAMDALRLGASLTWAGTLRADSASGPATSREYDLPLQLAAGASAYLAPSLLATVSGRWSGWSSMGDIPGTGLQTGITASGNDTWEVGGGLELDNPASRATRSFPVRLGGQYRQLPFTFGGSVPTEWYVGGGVGMRVGATADNPLVRADLSVQRGERTAAGNTATGNLTESAWRFSLSLSIFGN